MAMNVQQKIAAPFQGLNYAVKSVEALNYIAKFATNVISALGQILRTVKDGVQPAIDFVAKLEVVPFAAFTEIADFFGIAERANDFINPAERKKLVAAPLKLVSRITLAAGQALGVVATLAKYEIINIGAFVSEKLGNLPIIGFVKNAVITVSAGFSIADNAVTIHKAGKYAAKIATNNTGKAANKTITDAQGQQAPKYNIVDRNAFDASKLAVWTTKDVNAQIAKRKAIVGIIADIAKIAVIALATVALVFALANPIAWIAVAVLGATAAATGFVKSIYGEFWGKSQPLPAVAG